MTYPLVECGETRGREAVAFIGELLLKTARITGKRTITTSSGAMAIAF